MDSESTRQFLAASQLCEDALIEWTSMGVGCPQIFIHNFLAQSEDVFIAINGASFAIAGEVPSDVAEFKVWLGGSPVSRSTAHQVAAEMLINIFHTVNDVLNQLGYCDRSPRLQDDHTRSFPDSDALTVGDWAYAHQHQITAALSCCFSPPDAQSPCEEAGVDEVEFNRMIARMVRERSAVEKEFALVHEECSPPQADATVSDGKTESATDHEIPSYTPDELQSILGCSDKSLARYAKKSHCERPGQGESNFKYEGDNLMKLLRWLCDKASGCSKGARDKAKQQLEVMET